MIYDAGLAAIIRASSGALMMMLGAFVLYLAPRRPLARGLATYLLAYGAHFVAANVAVMQPRLLTTALWTAAAANLVATAGLVVVALAATRLPVAYVAGIAAAGLQLVAIGGVFLLGVPDVTTLLPGAGASSQDAFVAILLTDALIVGTMLGVAALLAFASGTEPRWSFLALGLLVFPAWEKGQSLVTGGDWQSPLASLVMALACVVVALAWAWNARHPAGRRARNVSLATSALVFGGALFALGVDRDMGTAGIARILGASAIAYAVLRADLLGVSVAVKKMTRGSVATVALATTFIVAQIAENFFAAEYGLLLGSLVAGAFLFAARPIERALGGERGPRGTRDREVRDPTATPDERALNAYRRAVRLALEDGVLTPSEELALAEMADDLGISAAAATRVRQSVQADASKGGR